MGQIQDTVADMRLPAVLGAPSWEKVLQEETPDSGCLCSAVFKLTMVERTWLLFIVCVFFRTNWCFFGQLELFPISASYVSIVHF